MIERQWWNAKAPKEERDLADEDINRALRWREIERHLADIETVLCVGGTAAIDLAVDRHASQPAPQAHDTKRLER